MIKTSVGQALLMLLEKYREDPVRYPELKRLYLSGAHNEDSRNKIDEYLTDPALKDFEVSKEPEIISKDNSRRYFETHLAYETLASQLKKFSPEELTDYLQQVKDLAPPYYSDLYDGVLQGDPVDLSDNTAMEYADYLEKLRDNKIFSDFSADDREKISALVSAAYVAMVIASEGSHLLPMDIYGEGIYLQRGKVQKSGQKTTETNALGLLHGHSPLSVDDAARMPQTQKFLKPSDQSTYDPNAEWVKDNFSRLVHPFSNSVSGTMLCQLRALVNMQENLQSDSITSEKSIPLSKDKLEAFFALFISSMLFNSGGQKRFKQVF